MIITITKTTLIYNTHNTQKKMMKFTSAASALALSAFAQVQNDYVQCEVGMVGCNAALNPNVCFYVEDDQDCQTPGCNSGSWAPKILNVKQALS